MSKCKNKNRVYIFSPLFKPATYPLGNLHLSRVQEFALKLQSPHFFATSSRETKVLNVWYETTPSHRSFSWPILSHASQFLRQVIFKGVFTRLRQQGRLYKDNKALSMNYSTLRILTRVRKQLINKKIKCSEATVRRGELHFS